MRNWSSLLTAHYAQRKGRYARLLIWFEARNRDTQALETLGLWNGDDHLEFAIGGQNRLYYGAGTVMSIEPLVLTTGLTVQSKRLVVSSVSDEVKQLIRGYDTKLAPVEIHVAHFDPISGVLLEDPELKFQGAVDEVEIRTPSIGESSETIVKTVSQSYKLRNTLADKKSNAALTERAPGDAFRQDTDVAGSVETVWGEVRAAAPPPPAPAPDAPEVETKNPSQVPGP